MNWIVTDDKNERQKKNNSATVKWIQNGNKIKTRMYAQWTFDIANCQWTFFPYHFAQDDDINGIYQNSKKTRWNSVVRVGWMEIHTNKKEKSPQHRMWLKAHCQMPIRQEFSVWIRVLCNTNFCKKKGRVTCYGKGNHATDCKKDDEFERKKSNIVRYFYRKKGINKIPIYSIKHMFNFLSCICWPKCSHTVARTIFGCDRYEWASQQYVCMFVSHCVYVYICAW